MKRLNVYKIATKKNLIITILNCQDTLACLSIIEPICVKFLLTQGYTQLSEIEKTLRHSIRSHYNELLFKGAL